MYNRNGTDEIDRPINVDITTQFVLISVFFFNGEFNLN